MGLIPPSLLNSVFLRKCQGPPIPGKTVAEASLVAPQMPPLPMKMKTSKRPSLFCHRVCQIEAPAATPRTKCHE